jgi:Ankyrin repeats (3 copies)
LHIACRFGEYRNSYILQLIDIPPDAVHKQNNKQEYPLHGFFLDKVHSAVRHPFIGNHKNSAMKLMTLCPEALNQPNYRGRTPFHIACDSGKMTMVKLLSTPSFRCSLPLIHINAVDHEGNTPLHLSAKLCVISMDCLPLLQFLLSHPFLIANLCYKLGQLPSHWVQEMVRPNNTYEHCKVEAKEIVTMIEKLDIKRRNMAYWYFVVTMTSA